MVSFTVGIEVVRVIRVMLSWAQMIGGVNNREGGAVGLGYRRECVFAMLEACKNGYE